MPNLLILGASSQIGQEIAIRFASNNNLFITGRNTAKLGKVAKKCLESGAINVEIIYTDFSKDADQLINKIEGHQIDLIINLIAATSRIMDDELMPERFESYVFSDLLAPIHAVNRIFEKLERKPDIIFISSVLASIRSPNREIYGSLKRLQEIYWERLLKKSGKGSLLIVRVGKKISHTSSDAIATDLANEIYSNYLQKNKVLGYGWEGKFYSFLFYFQPVLMQWLIKFHRIIRRN